MIYAIELFSFTVFIVAISAMTEHSIVYLEFYLFYVVSLCSLMGFESCVRKSFDKLCHNRNIAFLGVLLLLPRYYDKFCIQKKKTENVGVLCTAHFRLKALWWYFL